MYNSNEYYYHVDIIIHNNAQQSDVFGFISMVILYYNMLLPYAHAQQATITIENFAGY